MDRIVLVGAGKTSGSLVERLARIAPLTVIDTSPAALDAVSTRDLQAAEGGHPVVKRAADGTSRLVLSDLRGDPRSSVALVVAPGDDRAALESCRLGAELAFKPLVAIVNDSEIARGCESHGARALVRAELVGQLVEQTLLQGGVGVSSAVGFGRGELLEFQVLPSSRAIGIPLSKLPTVGWRIAAIYRGKELVLPTGATRIAPDDRVLVIGDPRQLPHVAELLRVGIPTFPLLHGPNVVAYMPVGREGGVEMEAEVLTGKTRAVALVRAYPGAAAARNALETPGPDGAPVRKRVEDVALEGDDLARHVELLRARQPGVVVTHPRARTPVDVLLGRGGREALLCNAIDAPVLFPRGSPHYQRILLCVTDGAIDLGVAEVALDLARMFAVPLVVLRVKLPSYLQEAQAATDVLLETIGERARLYGVAAETRVLEGNPISVWVAASTSGDSVGRRARSHGARQLLQPRPRAAPGSTVEGLGAGPDGGAVVSGSEDLRAIFVLVLLSVVGPVLAVRVRMPAAVVLVLVGVVFGPAVLTWVTDTPTVGLLSELGFLVLMFVAGMEIDFETLRSVGPRGVAGPALAVLAFGGIGAAFAAYLHLLTVALLVVTASSVGMPLAVLHETGRLQSPGVSRGWPQSAA